MASRYPNPTNAIAVAALDAFSQPDAESLISSGVPETVARAFLLPDGVFPRMRLLAWGWTKQGDRFKSPSDAAWWKRRYQYPLWAPIETYVDQVTRAGNEPPAVAWDDDLARGDPVELSRSLPAVVQQDLPPVNQAPCPKWIIPPGRGMLPIANPECLKKDLDKLKEQIPKIPGFRPARDWTWLLWLAIGYLILESNER